MLRTHEVFHSKIVVTSSSISVIVSSNHVILISS